MPRVGAEPAGPLRPLIADLSVEGTTVTVKADPAFSRDFLLEDFTVEYDASVDMAAIPGSLLTVPFLANVVPVVWATGTHVRIAEMDGPLARSLEEIRPAFKEMFPGVSWDGAVHPDRTVEPEMDPQGERTSILFSSGLDSTYSSMADETSQLLVTIWGTDIALDNRTGWRVARDQTLAFAGDHGHQAGFIRSNLRTFIDASGLRDRFPDIPNWWLHVQHGLGLSGLAAPLVAARGFTRVVVSSGRMVTQRSTLGAGPDLEGRLRWSGARVEHFGDDRTRHDKLRFVVEAMRSRALHPHPLRVCFMYPYGGGGNCGRCEKCLRTMAALLIEGEEPRAWGFPWTVRSITSRIRRRFRNRTMLFGEGPEWFWTEIQERAATFPEGRPSQVIGGEDVAPFARWMASFDFATYRRRWSRRGRARAWALRQVRRSPLVTRLLMRAMALLRRRRLTPQARAGRSKA